MDSAAPPPQTYVALVCSLGGSWLEGNFLAFLDLLLELPSSSRATQTAADAALTRRCVCFILRSSLTALPGEKAQVSAATQLALTAAAQQRVFGELRRSPPVSGCMEADPVTPVCPESALTGGNVEARGSCLDAAASPHALVCCLQELGALLLRLGATASSLLTDGSTGLSHTRALTHGRMLRCGVPRSPLGHAALLPSPPDGLGLSGCCLEPALCCRGDAIPGFPAAGALLPASAGSEVCS